MTRKVFLVYASVSSVLEMALLLGALLWLLPTLGVVPPRGVIIAAVAILVSINIVLTYLNLRAIGLRPIRSPDIGGRVVVVRSLTPRGYVRVGNELWPAECERGEVERGRTVSIVRMEKLRLIVEPADGAPDRT